MERENKYRGVATLVVVLTIAFFVVLETKLLVGGSSATVTPGANGYVAGEYTGTGNGNGGAIKVKVTFSDTEILSIEVIEQNETKAMYEMAADPVIEAIIAAQSSSVDAVSGATMTSNGIMQAVKDAMTQAAK